MLCALMLEDEQRGGWVGPGEAPATMGMVSCGRRGSGYRPQRFSFCEFQERNRCSTSSIVGKVTKFNGRCLGVFFFTFECRRCRGR